MEFTEKGITQYLEKHTTPEPEVLQELSRDTQANVLMSRMLSGHQQGTFLRMMTAISGAKTVLDIGTYTGYSAISMAMGLPEDGKVHTIDINDELKKMVAHYIDQAGLNDRIQTWWGEAAKIIPQIEDPVDLVFIDADKENYSLYYDLVFDKISPGGLIIADNVLWSGKVLNMKETDKDTQALRDYNEMVQKDDRVENIMLSLRDGLLIARKL